MKLTRTCLLALLMGISLSAVAQWQWVDRSGRKVFSDQPPGADIPESSILRRPGGPRPAPAAAPSTGSGAAGTAEPAAATKPANTASQAKGTGKDSELEKKKNQAEAQAAAKKKEDDQKEAARKADNCDRAKRNIGSLQSGVRIAQVNAAGEREFMSDEAKAAELKRVQGIADADCKP